MSELERLFPTAGKRIQIYHRAGLLEYPPSRKSSVLDSPAAPWTRVHRIALREKEIPSEDMDQSQKENEEEEEESDKEAAEERRAQLDNLEQRVEELTLVVKKLIAAIVQSRKTLDGGLDDPSITEILDSMRSPGQRSDSFDDE